MTPSTQRNGRLVAVAGLLALVLPLSGCGTRMSSEAIESADGTAISSQAANSGAGALGADSGVLAPTTTDTGVAAPTGPATTGTAASPSRAGSAASGSGGTTGGTAAGTNAGTKTGGAVAATVPTAPNAPCTQALPPIVLGQTLAVSGLVGQSIANIRTGVALWAKAINAAGGVQCHPIQLYQMDDAADPARVTSNLNELVKNKKSVAIIGAGIATTTNAGKQFAERNKIPFIGGDLAEPTWYSSPYMFPQGGSALANFTGATKGAGDSVGGKKVGLVYCVEAAVCGIINSNFREISKAAGLELAVSKVSSLTSPDYTAECQAMKSAEVDVVFLALDGSGDSRAARSCRALGVTAPVATSALGINPESAQDPNLRALGVYLGNGNAPFMATDTAGGKLFRAAYDRLAPGSPLDQNTMTGWASGKLFEAAMSKVATKARSGPVTTELILDGLWQLKKETLGGIAPPLTFTRGELPASNDCSYLLVLKTDGFSAPNGSRLDCFTTLPRGF